MFIILVTASNRPTGGLFGWARSSLSSPAQPHISVTHPGGQAFDPQHHGSPQQSPVILKGPSFPSGGSIREQYRTSLVRCDSQFTSIIVTRTAVQPLLPTSTLSLEPTSL